MIAPRIAVETQRLGLPIKQALLMARRVQCDGVQFDLRGELPAEELSATGLRELRKMLDDLNLRVGSGRFPTRRGFAEPQDLERRLQATLGAIAHASRLGARTLLINPGELPAPDSKAWTTLLEALQSLAAAGSRYGVSMALDCSSDPVAAVRDLLAELPGGLFGVNLDPAELIRHRRSPAEFAEELGPHVLHLAANDAVRSLGSAGAVDVQLGRGSAELPEVLGRLEECDYRGWITIQPTGENAVQSADDAVHFLRSL